MLYESKADGSLAAHATQSNLRLVPNPHRNADGTSSFTVRHGMAVLCLPVALAFVGEFVDLNRLIPTGNAFDHIYLEQPYSTIK